MPDPGRILAQIAVAEPSAMPDTGRILAPLAVVEPYSVSEPFRFLAPISVTSGSTWPTPSRHNPASLTPKVMFDGAWPGPDAFIMLYMGPTRTPTAHDMWDTCRVPGILIQNLWLAEL